MFINERIISPWPPGRDLVGFVVFFRQIVRQNGPKPRASARADVGFAPDLVRAGAMSVGDKSLSE
jgi:hypothetical protein